MDTWESPQQVQGSGRTTHFDRVTDIACSNVEHLHRGTTHCDRVSDIALKQENLEHGGLCERASSYGRCIPLDKNTQPFSSFDPVSELSVHSDRRPWLKIVYFRGTSLVLSSA